jgi:hypothetical protein
VAIARDEGDAAIVVETLLLAAMPMALRPRLAAQGSALATEARALAIRIDEPWWVAFADSLVGIARMMTADGILDAVRLLQATSRRFRELGDQRSAAISDMYLSRAAEDSGDLDLAESLLLADATDGDALVSVGAITSLARLVWIAVRRGDFDRADAIASQLGAATGTQHRLSVRMTARAACGIAALVVGRHQEAREHLSVAHEAHRGLGFERDGIIELGALAYLDAVEGDVDASVARHRESIDRARALGLPAATAYATEMYALSAIEWGDAIDAMKHLSWADAVREKHGLTRTGFEVQVCDAVRRRAVGLADAAAIEAAAAAGAAHMTPAPA